MADANKLHMMLDAIGKAMAKMHNSEDLNDAIAELQVHIDDPKTAEEATSIIDNLFDTVKDAFELASAKIADIAKTTVETEGASEITPKAIDEMAELATAFYNSGDELLMKQASVLDEILLTLSADKSAIRNFKKAQEDEVAKLREKSRAATREKDYDEVQAELDKQNKVAETSKALKEQVKQYRSLEAPLSTRSCPEHPGAQMSRIGDDTYQCSLDHKIYNWQAGFDTMKGNKVPGGDVQHQTIDYGTRDLDHTIFDDRASRLNNNS